MAAPVNGAILSGFAGQVAGASALGWSLAVSRQRWGEAPGTVYAGVPFLLWLVTHPYGYEGTGATLEFQGVPDSGTDTDPGVTAVSGVAPDITQGWADQDAGGRTVSMWARWLRLETSAPAGGTRWNRLRIRWRSPGMGGWDQLCEVRYCQLKVWGPDTFSLGEPFLLQLEAVDGATGTRVAAFAGGAALEVKAYAGLEATVDSTGLAVAITDADGDPLDLSTGWADGVWEGQAVIADTDGMRHVMIEADGPGATHAAEFRHRCLARMPALSAAIYERQKALRYSVPWDENAPAEPTNLISLNYAYSLAEYQAYVALLAPEFLEGTYASGATAAPACLPSDYAAGAADFAELLTLVRALRVTVHAGLPLTGGATDAIRGAGVNQETSGHLPEEAQADALSQYPVLYDAPEPVTRALRRRTWYGVYGGTPEDPWYTAELYETLWGVDVSGQFGTGRAKYARLYAKFTAGDCHEFDPQGLGGALDEWSEVARTSLAADAEDWQPIPLATEAAGWTWSWSVQPEHRRGCALEELVALVTWQFQWM